MSGKNKIAFYENEFPLQIESNLSKLIAFRKIHKTQKNDTNKKKILKIATHKIRALQLLLAANGGCTKNKMPHRPQEMNFIIDHFMMMQHSIMQLAELISHYNRLLLLFIFFQSFLMIIFNSYNLVMYLLRLLSNATVKFDLFTALLFYGYSITTPLFEIVVTITYFSLNYSSLERTPILLHTLIIYAQDDALKSKLFQYAMLIRSNIRKYSVFGMYFLDGSFISATISVTATYIIILIQYGTPEFLGNHNETNAIK